MNKNTVGNLPGLFSVSSTDIRALGIMPGKNFGLALKLAQSRGLSLVASVVQDSVAYLEHADPEVAAFAAALSEAHFREQRRLADQLHPEPLPYAVFGLGGYQTRTGIQQGAFDQMDMAMRLPITVKGALMPDAHQGYGLPIGGVLATRDAVIPYAVGVDIGCAMMLSITEIEASEFRSEDRKAVLRQALRDGTHFGAGRTGKLKSHAIEGHPLLSVVEHHVRQNFEAIGVQQLGTSGGGNHFVEWGEIIIDNAVYLAILSHSGGRGLAARTADYYSKLAVKMHDQLAPEAQKLAWLPLRGEGSAEGEAYWAAMKFVGDYSRANHEVIHEEVLRQAGLSGVQIRRHFNAHNLAWKEQHGGEELIVHRKGATPAQMGQWGIIPGSMADPTYLVQGKGSAESLHSSSHGAGRQFGRMAALREPWAQAGDLAQDDYLRSRGVEVLGGGHDENPRAYKRIEEVIAAQETLVEVRGVFHPKIVMMADDTIDNHAPDPSLGE